MDGPETFKGESAEVRNPVQKSAERMTSKKSKLGGGELLNATAHYFLFVCDV